MWLEDLLSIHSPESRIMLFEFNSSSTGSGNLFSPEGFDRAAKSLLEQLFHVRNSSKVHSNLEPIIFLC
jgi:hypothetical protein